MKFLITGASGFIGSHLAERLLNDGHSVVNVDNFDNFYDYKIKVRNTLSSVGLTNTFKHNGKETDLKELERLTASENYRLYCADIRDRSAMNDIFTDHAFDMVIHLAALAGVRPSIERPVDYESVNIHGTMNLWQLCKEYGINKFICASSSSIYGNNEKVPFSEDDNVDRPISPYAATKKAGEVMGHVYHHLYNIDMIQLRFFTVYGPRQRPDLAIHKFAKLMTANTPIPVYGDGTTARDYTYIDDIVAGICGSIQYLTDNEDVYEIINLGENQVISLREMIDTLSAALRIRPDLLQLPMQPGDVKRTSADITKAAGLIGYKPRVDFHSGIKNFVEWFLRIDHQN